MEHAIASSKPSPPVCAILAGWIPQQVQQVQQAPMGVCESGLDTEGVAPSQSPLAHTPTRTVHPQSNLRFRLMKKSGLACS